MSFCGVSITPDLACIACVADAEAAGLLMNGEAVAVEMFTYADGRAFKDCAYFPHWKATNQFFLNDATVEDLDMGRVILEFQAKFDGVAVGFNRDQLLLAASYAVPIPKECEQVLASVRMLNRYAAQNDGFLFPPNSALQHMWTSLPLMNGERIFPTTAKPALGRYDGIRAVVNAMCCATHFVERAKGRMV